MQKVENGKFVCVAYTGTFDTGDVFDTSEGGEPMELQIGGGNVVQGFEDALLGMEMNEKKVFTLDPDAAYGHRDETHVHTFSRNEIPPDMEPEVGEVIGLQTPDGEQIPAQITHADDEKVVVDLNHPLAGKSLTFEVEIVGISDEPTQAHDCGCGTHECGSGGGGGGGGGCACC